VKERLAETGMSSRYHEFLTAVSDSTVNHDVALSILEGHNDLISAFRKCFAPVLEEPAYEEVTKVQDSLADRRGTNAKASQLVQVVFSGKTGHEYEQSKMLDYVKKQVAQAVFPRKLVLLRGPPGAGKTDYAHKALNQDVDGYMGMSQGEQLAIQLTHVCATDDFFMQFKPSSTDMKYVFNHRHLAANHITNQARVRLAMELGISPVYVDNANMKLWEMRPYVMLADRMGYVVSVVQPSEICACWNDVSFLALRNEEESRRTTDKYVSKQALEASLASYEAVPDTADPRPTIRAATPPDEGDGRFSVEASEVETKLIPTVMLYKFEKLLKEGKSLLWYTPPDGKGWGVNGELNGEWHSFREKGDGSCCYDDRVHWYTDDPENGWSFAELALLDDLRKEATSLPKADLPSATSHPGLFGKKPAKVATVKQTPAPKAPKASVQVAAASAPEPAAPVPVSRSERFKQRMRVKEEEVAGPPAKVKKIASRAPSKVSAQIGVEDEEDQEALPRGLPTSQEEMSAATFLAAVKARLTEWGKLDQYHEFVLALSGTVDAKAAVRILRGHDDLIRVFKRKFAPKADLLSIKAELDTGDEPHPPQSRPPSAVKQELDSKGVPTAPFTPKGSSKFASDVPRPPAAPFPGVKKELGVAVKKELGKSVKSEMKSEVKSEVMPRPPTYNPNAPRPTVTIGDDSDGEFEDEASISMAVRKGRDECIAQLAKTIFSKERASHEGARIRLAMVRYATRRAAKPRFPRELYIMRGPPGIGKTQYAMQQLADYADFEAEEETAARLTHVCAADDFFEVFKEDGSLYQFELSKIESYHRRNEVRARLAMEAGIHPIFIDCVNAKLWEMRSYVMLADRLGYVVNIVEPHEICEKWDDVDFLVSANDTTDRVKAGKLIKREMLDAFVKAFQTESSDDPLDAVRKAGRSEGIRAIEPSPEQAVDGPRPSSIVKPELGRMAGPRPSSAVAGSGPRPPAWTQVKAELPEAQKRGPEASWTAGAQKAPRFNNPRAPGTSTGKGWQRW